MPGVRVKGARARVRVGVRARVITSGHSPPSSSAEMSALRG